tara:strand:- start:552 stop:6419 length:5868 start_codon:yes stop_codon:yes gene_type:complete
MPLSRLDNFLKNVRGNIIYVNPNDLDATDDVTNQGNSMAKPFVTIQRALIEAARFSYQAGLDNDRFGKTTIMLSPGEHYVDNRPGWIPEDGTNYLLRNGVVSSDFTPFNTASNFDVKSSTNDLYKLNSVHGGVIIPRGTSIVGQDLRKTKIRPLYVPDPTNDNIARTSIFRVTGATYFWQFTIFDGDPTGTVYKNYTDAEFVPNFSHHKLTCFEYADGRNNVYINDSFIVNTTFTRTDLEMYYEKVGLAYGPASGRTIQPDFPSSGLDIQPKIDEYRIVGPSGGSVGITSILSGDGTTATKAAVVTLNEGLEGLNVDTAIQINGSTDAAYNGTFIVTGVNAVDNNGNITQFTYNTAELPTSALITPASATVELDTDTVTSASPYIFNISLRSVFGMCGMHADGNKADGFKSMVVAQFTAVSLQKDDNAFVKYDAASGSFLDSTSVDNIHSDGDATYKPAYYNFHIKASNNSVCQLVSIFAIGFAQQFVTESGGDFSVTNSNSNFGQNALVSKGYRDEAFLQDDVGFISHVIPPRLITTEEFNLEYQQIDVSKTVSVGNTSRLYLYQQDNLQAPPPGILQGYRIGAKVNDQLKVGIATNGTGIERELTARIVMPNTAQSTRGEATAIKRRTVNRVGTSNSITSNIISFTENHQFATGETIRFISDNARLPDGIDNNKVYFAVTGGSLNPDQIKVASSLNEALDGNEITINNLGGTLMCESRVSDKITNGIGHPIQYDTTETQWYVNVSGASTENTIYSNIVSLGTTFLGEATQRTYITRQSDTRSLSDKNYKFRYVIPSASGITSARAPRLAYVLEESNDVTGSTNTEVQLEYSPTTVSMNNVSEMRNFRFIRSASYNAGLITVVTERDHGLTLGSLVQLNNITSSINTTGIGNSGYNKTYTVANIPSSTVFIVQEPVSDPGTFTNNTSLRTTDLPTFKRLRAPNNYYVYDIETVREYKAGVQDGVYYLTIVDATSTPTIEPFTDRSEFAFSQPIQRLFPQYNRDNINSDPPPAVAYAPAEKLGSTVIDDVQNSITKTTVDRGLYDLSIGAGITDIVSNSAGTAHTIFTDVDHSFNRITNVSVNAAGSGYGNGTGGESLYNATLTGSATGQNATARITVNASGEMTSAVVMNAGTNYQSGDILTVSGTATTTGFSAGSLRVDSIYNNVGDTVRISGITSFSYKGYNQLYRVTGISTVKEIQVESLNVVNGASTSGVGATVSNISFVGLTGPSITVSSLVYDRITGLGTITTSAAHNYRTNNQIVIGGASEDFYNGAKPVTEVVGLTTFVANFGKLSTTPSVSGTIRTFPPGLVAQAGALSLYDENFGGRVLNVYNNLTCNLVSDIANATTDEINITNLSDFDLKIGDYIRIDDEMMRIKTTVTGNPVKVFRGLFDTQARAHIAGSVIVRGVVAPLELRRPSYTRASGHTFEYLGFGPGNYSTALPIKQSGQPDSAEQLNSQRMNTAAGVNVFTGMNDQGDFFIGNKRITSSTGKEEVFDTPVPSITGEDVTALGTDVPVDFLETTNMNVGNTLNVEGGTTGNLLSQFDGPVLFNSKVTVSRDFEAGNFFLQGSANVSRKYTVGISTPTVAGTAGDVVWKAAPSPGGKSGWIYTTDNQWHPYGFISLDAKLNVGKFDQVGIATTSPGDCTLKVGSGTSLFCVDSGGVGVGTTANGFKFRVNGESRFDGSIVATAFTGDGSGLTNLQNDSLFTGVSGVGTGIHPLNNLNVGIGTENPSGTYTLELGTAGTGTTDLYVANAAQFISTARFDGDVNIAGKFTATDFDINSSSHNVTVGVLTATNINVGTSGTIITTTSNGVGINSTSPTTELDVDGRARIQTVYSISTSLSSSSGVVTVDLSRGQIFNLTTIEDITQFTLVGVRANAAQSFTIKITQGSTARNVGIATFKTQGGTDIPVLFPSGLLPIVTVSAGATDIYSFMTFDGGQSLFGVVGGQNFS